jgi:serine/threonine protein kinase/tetratricopeptide (TPR) repeat protein
MICPTCQSPNPYGATSCSACSSSFSGAEEATLKLAADVAPEMPTMASPTSLEEWVKSQPTSAMSASSVLPEGLEIARRYRVRKLLGIGGMGAVYRVHDDELDRDVALKLIRSDIGENPEALERFKREIQLSSKVTHKNVLRVYDLGASEGIKYLTMQFVEGEDLSTILKREGRLPNARLTHIFRQILEGLIAAHEQGVVHRDLKPQNIMLDASDNVFVTDFGLAKSLEQSGMTQTGVIVGTPYYMSPEQVKGSPIDHRSDIYSLGVILYQMSTGQLPFTGSSPYEVMAQRLHAVPAPAAKLNPDLPAYLGKILERCMTIDPVARYQTVRDVLTDLDAGGFRTTLRFEVAKRPWLRPTLAAVLIVGLGAGALLLFRARKPQPPASPGAANQAISLAILPFRNASGDSSIDWLGPSLAEMLLTDVGRSASLRTVPPNRIQQVLRDLRISSESTVDPATVRKLAQFSSADSMVSGQYLKLGSAIRIDATLEDVQRQRSIHLKAQAPDQNGLQAAVDQLAQAIREGLSLSSDALKEMKATAFKPSTHSLEALKSYNEGLQLARQGNQSEALKKFQDAVHADSEFALAYARLAQTYSILGYDTEAEKNSRRAVEIAQRLPAQERYLINASHARIVNDTEKAIAAYEGLAKVSPDDSEVNFELAGLYEGSGDFDKARIHYKKVLERDPKYVAALLASGRVEIKAGNPQASLDSLNQALSVAIQLEQDEGKADVLHAIGTAYKSMDKPSEALRYYGEALEIRRRIGLKRGIAVTLGQMAEVQERLGNLDAALASYKEALQMQRDIGDKKGMGLTLIALGSFYEDRGNSDQALQLYKESLQIQRDVGNQDVEGHCLNHIGNVYLFKTQYDDAQTYFERALQIREKTKNPGDLADTLHNLAETATNKGQYDQALKDYLRALELRRDSGDKEGAAIESFSMGTVFEYQGKYGAALDAKEEALKAFRELKEEGVWMGEILSGTGHAETMIGRSDAAPAQFAEALKVSDKLKNKALEGQILNFQGDGLFYLGDFKGARPLYERALQDAAKTGDRRLELQSKANLAKCAIAAGRSQETTDTLQKLSGDADSLGLKYLSVESTVFLGQALIAGKRYPQARQELERALAKAEKLGARSLEARAHFLLASTPQSTGEAAEASRHLTEARRILDEIRKEAKTDAVVKRADLAPILAEAG